MPALSYLKSHHQREVISNDIIISNYECKVKFIALERITIMECAALASFSSSRNIPALSYPKSHHQREIFEGLHHGLKKAKNKQHNVI